jgi:ATP-dependent RNA helicase HelY
MAANLVRSYSSERAHHLLNLSFAQYQADRDVVRIEARLERRQRHLADLLEQSRSPYGDIDDYRRRQDRERGGDAGGATGRDDVITLAILKLKPGDVIHATKGRYSGRVAVLTVAHRKGGARISGVTTRGDVVALTAADFFEPPRPMGQVQLPEGYEPGGHRFQQAVAERLGRARIVSSRGGAEPWHEHERATHPVEDDPELDDRLKAAAQAERVAKELDELRQRMRGRSQSVARDFDRVLDLLQRWGYVDGWALTEAGRMLSRTFHESDLLVVETLRRGLLDGLDPATFASVVSVFVYEHRSPDEPPPPWFPTGLAKRRWQSIERLSLDLSAEETHDGLPVHRAPDPTFAAVAFAWAAGEGFADVVSEEEMSGGDFVRTMKQLIDLVRQLALVAPEAATRRVAEQAADALFRGVVAASSTVEVAGDDPQG